MSLSDEVLRRPGSLAALRKPLEELVFRTGARAAFLVDEQGSPFAATGTVEFAYPHPLSHMAGGTGGASLLEALVGEESEDGVVSDLVVVAAGPRALLVLVLEEPAGGTRRRAAASQARRAAAGLAELLAFKTGRPGE